jgi:hypothetical protein
MVGSQTFGSEARELTPITERSPFYSIVEWEIRLDNKTPTAHHEVRIRLCNVDAALTSGLNQKIVISPPKGRNCGDFETCDEGLNFHRNFGLDRTGRYAPRLSELQDLPLCQEARVMVVRFPEAGAIESGISEKQYEFGYRSSFRSRRTRLVVNLPEVRSWLLRALVLTSAFLQGKGWVLYDAKVRHRTQVGMTGWEELPDLRRGRFVCNTKEVQPGSVIVFSRVNINPVRTLFELVRRIVGGLIGGLFKSSG